MVLFPSKVKSIYFNLLRLLLTQFHYFGKQPLHDVLNFNLITSKIFFIYKQTAIGKYSDLSERISASSHPLVSIWLEVMEMKRIYEGSNLARKLIVVKILFLG